MSLHNSIICLLVNRNGYFVSTKFLLEIANYKGVSKRWYGSTYIHEKIKATASLVDFHYLLITLCKKKILFMYCKYLIKHDEMSMYQIWIQLEFWNFICVGQKQLQLKLCAYQAKTFLSSLKHGNTSEKRS